MMRTSVFRRSPLLLLAAALMALAVFLAPGAQSAQAQTTTVWSATLTGQEFTTNTVGCSSGQSLPVRKCSTTTTLTKNAFTYGGTNYKVYEIAYNSVSNRLTFGTDTNSPGRLRDLVLQVDGTSFAIADATIDNSALTASWSNAGLSWSHGGTVELSLKTAPPPTVSLSASATTVREGTSVTVTATLSRSRTSETVVPVTLHASSTEDGDHGALASITIPANSTTGTGVITTTMDSDTDDEVFHVGLDNAAKDAGYAWGAVSWLDITILDSGLRQVSLSVSPNPVPENGLAVVALHVTSLRWGTPASLGSAVTIPLTFTAGSAESGDHETLTSITIPSGSTSGVSTITTAQDTDADDETFTIALDTANAAWPSGVKAGAVASVQVRITDDDAASPGTLSVDTGFENPACGSTISVTSVKPQWALLLSPAPSSDAGTEYRVLADANGGWLAGVPVHSTGSSVFTSTNTFAGLRDAYPGFRGFEYRLADHADVTASCTWTFQTGGV